MRIRKYLCIVSIPVLALCLFTQAQAGGSTVTDGNMLQELKKMIEEQQVQIDRQAAELAELKELLAGKSNKLTAKTVDPDKTGRSAEKGKTDVAAEDGGKEINAADKMVTSKLSNINLSLYGHVNKAGLFVDSGDSSDWYVVDNINSQTRLGLRAAADTGIGWVAGGRIEYGIVSNGSSDVNQLTSYDATENNFKLRWAEVSFKKDQFGKISLGKGSSATDNTSRTDLSGTAVAAYSSVSDMAGSTLWYDNSIDTLSDLKIKNVFNDFNGLGRTDRLRYDTPSLGGFSLAGSGSSGDAYDGALLFSRKYGETKIAAAFGVASPGDLIEGTDLQYSGSVSLLLPMGFNATLSAASRNLAADNREDPTNWWTKLGYKTKFYDAAVTAFSIEFGETADLWADGDVAKNWAAAVVHNVTDWGTELYMAYRGHQLDSDLGDFDDIHAFWAGARVKF